MKLGKRNSFFTILEKGLFFSPTLTPTSEPRTFLFALAEDTDAQTNCLLEALPPHLLQALLSPTPLSTLASFFWIHSIYNHFDLRYEAHKQKNNDLQLGLQFFFSQLTSAFLTHEFYFSHVSRFEKWKFLTVNTYIVWCDEYWYKYLFYFRFQHIFRFCFGFF